jgi:flagellin-like protein
MFKELFDSDDRGVSPVIGVILMVAITVILAAVIGAFVLELGSSAATEQPQASFDFEFNGSNVTVTHVTVTHQGGSEIDNSSISVVLDKSYNDSVYNWSGADEIITAGESMDSSDISTYSGGADTVQVVWNGENGQSAVLAERDFPN